MAKPCTFEVQEETNMPANRVTSEHPWHVVFLIDDSISMSSNGGSTAVNEAMQYMMDEMEQRTKGLKPYFKISIVSFGSDYQDVAVAKSEQDIDTNHVTQFKGNSGTTNAAAALIRACEILESHPGRTTDFEPFVFFLSDGQPDNEALALQAGDRLKAMTIASGQPRVVTIGFGQVNDGFMRSLASNPEVYKRLQTADEIVHLLPAIGTIVGGGGSGGAQSALVDIANTSVSTIQGRL